MPEIDKNSRICIIGGGPGGLSAGYYLQKAGYKDVTILEKLPEVGGLCNTISYKNHSFDLGANYLTPAYKKTLKLAREVGAELYTEDYAYCFDIASEKYNSLFRQVTKGISVLSFGWQAIRYFYERWKAGKQLPEAGFAGVSQHPDLTCTFSQWLADKNLTLLERIFEIPITLMGYGELDDIPAPYALTYMSNATFFNLIWYGAGLPSAWPKRFIYGFQRLWQKVSWNLTVITSVEIHKIQRNGKIKLSFTAKEQRMNKVEESKLKEMEFDYLIVAVPLMLNVLEDLFTDPETEKCSLTKEEAHLFSKVKPNPFCLTTFVLKDGDLPHRLVNILPRPDPEMVYPQIVTQQFKGNPLVSFYTSTNTDAEPSREKVIEGVKNLCKSLNKEVEDEYYTYDRWTYYPHVPVLDIKEGYYDELESLQGQNNTFYTGGLMAFELIEPIVNYSDYLVKNHFLK